MENQNLEEAQEVPKRYRWKPVKEQLYILMSLYEQGMRRPSPTQVRIIAARLRGYGRIEDSSVYFWFQNYGFRKRWRAMKKNEASSSVPPPPVGVLVETVVSAPMLQTLDLFPLTPMDVEREFVNPEQGLALDLSTELSLRIPFPEN